MHWAGTSAPPNGISTHQTAFAECTSVTDRWTTLRRNV